MTTHSPRTVILVIEDEPHMRRLLRTSLDAHGFVVIESENGEEGMRRAQSHKPDVILLDLGLPDMDGLDVTRTLRTWTQTPIVVLSARGREEDKVVALDAGANDYLTKPFGTNELLARIRVALRLRAASQTTEEAVFKSGDLTVDRVARRVFIGEQEVHLTPTEYKLLTLFLSNAGRVLTHHHILREVWGTAGQTHPHYLRVYMGQLRNKLEKDPAQPRFFRTETGVGYRFIADES
ncbi:MAG: response regulator [Polyangiaceae bacterium]